MGKRDGDLFGINFSAIKNTKNWKEHFSECSSLLSNWNNLCLDGKNDLTSFQTGLSKNDDEFRKYISTVKDGSASLEGYKEHLKSTGVEFEKAFNPKSFLANFAVGFLASAGIELAVAGITKLLQTGSPCRISYRNNICMERI